MTNHELKALRLSLQMNQKEFADSFGVSLRTLQAYESGLTPIPESRIRAYQAEHPQSTPSSDPQPTSSTEATQGQLPLPQLLPTTTTLSKTPRQKSQYFVSVFVICNNSSTKKSAPSKSYYNKTVINPPNPHTLPSLTSSLSGWGSDTSSRHVLKMRGFF